VQNSNNAAGGGGRTGRGEKNATSFVMESGKRESAWGVVRRAGQGSAGLRKSKGIVGRKKMRRGGRIGREKNRTWNEK